MPNPYPVEITKTTPRELTIRWDDGAVTAYTIHFLRSECACARCVNENTGMRILDPRTIAEDLTILNAEPVGMYGIKFTFSDGHDNGIYTWERLRAFADAQQTGSENAASSSDKP